MQKEDHFFQLKQNFSGCGKVVNLNVTYNQTKLSSNRTEIFQLFAQPLETKWKDIEKNVILNIKKWCLKNPKHKNDHSEQFNMYLRYYQNHHTLAEPDILMKNGFSVITSCQLQVSAKQIFLEM